LVIQTLPPIIELPPILTRPRIVASAYIMTLSSTIGCLEIPLTKFPSSSTGKLFAPRVTP